MGYYYKFRSLQNIKYFLDIVLNNRLYAAKYNELNDPMEGIFRTKANQKIIQSLIDEKNNTRICSLSTDYKHTLLWSHYADGHKGCCIEVSIDNLNIKPINYTNDILDVNKEEDKELLLSYKSPIWEYEKEARAFLEGNPYLEVTIHQIIFGSKVSNNDFQFYKNLIQKINPDIVVSQMTQDEIYTGFNYDENDSNKTLLDTKQQ